MRSQPKQLSSSMRLTKRISLRPVSPILSTRFRDRENVRSNFGASPRTAGLPGYPAVLPFYRRSFLPSTTPVERKRYPPPRHLPSTPNLTDSPFPHHPG